MFNYNLHHYLTTYQRPIKWISGGVIGVIIIATISYLVIQHINHAGKIAVPLQVVPKDATITIDGSQTVRNGTVYITPGNHHVEVAKDGFVAVKKKYRIETYNAAAIYISLNGQSDAAKQWQNNHQEAYRRLELLATKQAHEYGQKFEERNPIIKDLPIKDPYFTISYRNVDDKSVRLTIWGTSARYREFALQYLRKKGYEPTDYQIEFTNFTNPLANKESHE